MKRLIYNQLIEWKNSPYRKPLVLLGARQVGKTYILNQMGNQEFDNMVYVNCHNNPFANSLFRDFNIDRILYDIEQQYETKISIGKTLLFFDEIQEVHNGLSSLKYFCENKRELHVVVAGSLLGISLRSDESYPVGKIDTLRMYPMTFGEFLLANDREKLYESLAGCRWDNLTTSHDTLVDYLRQYYFCGGMPEAVQSWVDHKEARQVRQIQSEILDAYERDIAKHSLTFAQRIHQVWNIIPAQLAKENKKFIFGMLKKVDVGLLAAMTETTPQDILIGDAAFSEFKGAFSENYVLEQIIAAESANVYYFSKDNSQLEIDFLLQTANRIIPTEVKAEENVKSKSLRTFIQEHDNLKGLRFSMRPYVDQGWMKNVPMYACGVCIQ